MTVPFWLYALVVVALVGTLYVITTQRDRARQALLDHLRECHAVTPEQPLWST